MTILSHLSRKASTTSKHIGAVLRNIHPTSNPADKQAQVIGFFSLGLAFAGVIVAILTLRAMRTHTDSESQIGPDIEMGTYKLRDICCSKLIKFWF
jgi:hypothetical protein